MQGYLSIHQRESYNEVTDSDQGHVYKKIFSVRKREFLLQKRGLRFTEELFSKLPKTKRGE